MSLLACRLCRPLAASFVALGLIAPSLAHAYTWARTAATQTPLRWPADAQIDWRAGSQLLAAQARGALEPWLATRCAGDALPWTLNESESAAGAPHIAWIEAPDAWTLGSDVIAYTAVAHNAGTGVISGFQMRLNGVTQQFCTDSARCGGAEEHLPTVLAHEWGHVWGLDHSDAATALMYGARHPGEVITAPAADDQAGLCALYAADRSGRDPTIDPGCSAAGTRPVSPRSFGVFGVFGVFAAMLLWTRRRLGLRRSPRRTRCGLAGAILVGLVGLGTQPAHAFVLARSASGAHQRWYVDEITYSVEDKGLLLQGISDAAVQASAARGFATWAAVRCDLCHDPRGVACGPVACASHPLGLSFRFIGSQPEQPALGCSDGSVPGPDNPTCVLVGNGSQIAFIDTGWPHGASVIATTIVAADQVTGRIADADIQFNTQDKTFCLDGDSCPPGEYDLDNTMTHEIGHLLGLDHSLDGEATMYGGAPPGEVIKRDLLADDIAGVCTAYRQAWAASGCPPEETGCCAAAPRARPQTGWPWILSLFAGGLIVLARRSLRRSAPRVTTSPS